MNDMAKQIKMKVNIKGPPMKCKQAFRAKHQQQQNLAKKSKFHEKMGNANDEEKS